MSDQDLVAELGRVGGTDPLFLRDPELQRMFLPAVRADYRAVETYQWQTGPPLSCPVSVFVGDRDPQVTLEEAEAWRAHTTGAVELQVFDGDHFYLVARAAEVMDRLARLLAAPEVPAPTP